MSAEVQRVTAGQFLERIKNADRGWFGVLPDVHGLIMYADGETIHGPDPYDQEWPLARYQAFVEEALRLTAMPAEERKNSELRVNFP